MFLMMTAPPVAAGIKPKKATKIYILFFSV